MKEFKLREGEEYIKLGQLLKAVRLAEDGSDAKFAIVGGRVTVNGEVCTMRGKKIHDGDEIAYNGEVIHVHQHT